MLSPGGFWLLQDNHVENRLLEAQCAIAHGKPGIEREAATF
jgi:hypothetical protein